MKKVGALQHKQMPPLAYHWLAHNHIIAHLDFEGQITTAREKLRSHLVLSSLLLVGPVDPCMCERLLFDASAIFILKLSGGYWSSVLARKAEFGTY